MKQVIDKKLKKVSYQQLNRFPSEKETVLVVDNRRGSFVVDNGLVFPSL